MNHAAVELLIAAFVDRAAVDFGIFHEVC